MLDFITVTKQTSPTMGKAIRDFMYQSDVLTIGCIYGEMPGQFERYHSTNCRNKPPYRCYFCDQTSRGVIVNGICVSITPCTEYA